MKRHSPQRSSLNRSHFGVLTDQVRHFASVSFLILLSLAVGGSRVAADESEPKSDSFAERYTKHEYRIPMRDGVKLYTVVFTPKDVRTGSKYPILLQRTPYNLKPYTVDAGGRPGYLPDSYVDEQFIFALQDVRGRFASEGTFVHVRPHLDTKPDAKSIDESTDTWDTIEWLVKNVRGNNGNVGMTGISYLGFYAAAGMIDSHPALKAVSPQAPVAALMDGDDTLHGGAFWLCHNWGFMNWFEQKLESPTREEPRNFDYGTPDGYRFYLEGGSLAALGDRYFKGQIPFWNDLVSHASDAAWCEARDISKHLHNVRAAVLSVGGWFDGEDLSGTLKTFRATGAKNPGIYNGLVMGPWSHGQWHGGDGSSIGPVNFHVKTAEYFRKEIEIPFFRRYLKNDTNAAVLPKAWVFETGVNEWRKESAWPPTNAVAKSLYFHPGGRLSFDAPSTGAGDFDEYVSDPAHPVPFTQIITTDMPREYMVEDQRFASTRPDVLVFQTEPLTEDVTLAGPLTASLHVSTTGTDSDWVVKLIDVYTSDHPNPSPNPTRVQSGHYQQLVRGEPLRGKYRDGMATPKPFQPGQVTKVEWTLPDICHTFRTGHRIMIQVQSSWFPLMDRNPQKFCDIYHAQPGDFQKATQRVYRTPATPSALKVLVVPGQ